MTARDGGSMVGEDLEAIERCIALAQEHSELLAGDREQRFVDGVEARLVEYRERAYLSPKQRRWLRSIWRRLEEAGVPTAADDPGDAAARPVDEVVR